jgi:hypothetical protein
MTFANTWAASRVSDPYDCSKEPPSGSSGNLTKYCLDSRYQSCAVKVTGTDTAAGQMKLADFFACAEGIPYTTKGTTSFADVIPCANISGLDTAAILPCFEGDEAVTLIDAVSKATSAAKPAVAYFPDIRVDGKQAGAATSADLVKSICAAYTGTKPAAC